MCAAARGCSAGTGGEGIGTKPLDMMISNRLRFGLALLLLIGQLVGVRAAIGASQTTATRTYSCCCVGECHCTADCCNHPPDRASDSSVPSLSKAGEWPILQSTNSCGAWQGIFNRASERSKLFRPRLPQLLDPTVGAWWHNALLIDDIPSSRALLSLISPRAPPHDLHLSPAPA